MWIVWPWENAKNGVKQNEKEYTISLGECRYSVHYDSNSGFYLYDKIHALVSMGIVEYRCSNFVRHHMERVCGLYLS